MALDPLVAQAVGADDHPAVTRALQRGLVIVVLLSVVTTLLLVPARQVLIVTRQQPEIIADTTAYVHISIPGILPYLAFVLFRQTLQALHRVQPIVWTIVGANLMNVELSRNVPFATTAVFWISFGKPRVESTRTKWNLSESPGASGFARRYIAHSSRSSWRTRVNGRSNDNCRTRKSWSTVTWIVSIGVLEMFFNVYVPIATKSPSFGRKSTRTFVDVMRGCGALSYFLYIRSRSARMCRRSLDE